MSKQDLKSALISIVTGAITFGLIYLLQGLLDLVKEHGPELFSAGVAAWRQAIIRHLT